LLRRKQKKNNNKNEQLLKLGVEEKKRPNYKRLREAKEKKATRTAPQELILGCYL